MKQAPTPAKPQRASTTLFGSVPPLAFWALFAALQLPALRPLAKFAPQPEIAIPAAFCVMAALLWALLTPAQPPALKRLLATPWPLAAGLIALALVAAFAYPMADAQKLLMGGSDADDAMILAGTALIHGHPPYLLTTYFGNPLSPGPGWIALIAPLSAIGLYPLLTTLAAAVLACVLYQTRHGWGHINMFFGALFSCLLVWELATVGNDLPAWGMLFLALLLVLGRPRLTTPQVIGLAALLGALATARIAFFYVPLLVGFSLFAVWPQRAVWVTVVGMGVMGGLHLLFASLTPGAYPPLHLLGRADGLLAGPALYAAGMLLAVVGVQLLYHWRWWPPVVHAAWGLGTPLVVLALAELAQHGDFARWEGATFWIPALPTVVYALLKPNFKN